MARTLITAQEISRTAAGLDVSLTASATTGVPGAGNGVQFTPGPGVFLHVMNTTVGALTFTVLVAEAAVDGETRTNLVRSVGANTGSVSWGPITSKYVQADGNVYVECSGALLFQLEHVTPVSV